MPRVNNRSKVNRDASVEEQLLIEKLLSEDPVFCTEIIDEELDNVMQKIHHNAEQILGKGC